MSFLSRFRRPVAQRVADHPAQGLDGFIADVGSGFNSNWMVVLQRTMGGGGVEPGVYTAALARVEAVARRPEHADFVAESQRRALDRARPIIAGAMAEISQLSPGSEVTEQQRIQTCEHFTRWAASAIALDGFIRPDDVSVLLDPFVGVVGIAAPTR